MMDVEHYRRSVARILLTNDDGVDSPALVPFARALRSIGTVDVIVPDRERSWVGKAITRFEPVRVEEIIHDDIRITACTGYPADAVQIGIHAANPAPDIVISGINLGYNHGVGFLMSSGTVGAAVEAWISGVPAIAISTGTMIDWQAWRRHAHDPSSGPAWERTARLCTELISDILETSLPALADIVSVNLPFDPLPTTPRRITTIARVGYDRLFRAAGGGVYIHDFGGGFREFEGLDDTDVAAAHAQEISITPIRMPQATAVPEDIRVRIEQGHHD